MYILSIFIVLKINIRAEHITDYPIIFLSAVTIKDGYI